MNREYGKFAEKIGAFAAPGSKVHIESQTIFVSGQDARSERQRGWHPISAEMLNMAITGNYIFHNNEKGKKERQQIDLPLGLASGQKLDRGEGDISLSTIGALVKLLEDRRNEETHRQVAEILGEIGNGDAEAIGALVKLLDNSRNEETRRHVAKALGKIGNGDAEAIGALVKLLDNSRNEETRRQVANALGKIENGDAEAIGALVKLLDNSRNEETCRQVANALREMGNGDAEAIGALVQVIQLDRDLRTNWPAAASLGKVCTVYYHLEKMVLQMRACKYLPEMVYCRGNFLQWYIRMRSGH